MTTYYKHPQALVETEHVGKGTRIWAFTHILPNAVIGNDCNICDHVFIENDVSLGDRVTVKCGVQLWDGITLEDDVFIGPNATFTNDIFPRSKHFPAAFLKTMVKKGASIGANATILPGITIGTNSMIGAGTVVVSDVPENAIVVGNPARIIGYADNRQTIVAPSSRNSTDLSVKGAKVYKTPLIEDIRGALTFAEFPKNLPFVPQRYFLIFNVPGQEVRGEHAHKTLEEFLVCVRGSCTVSLDDGYKKENIILDNPQTGLLIPSMVWGTQYKYSSDAILLVLASDVYKTDDYIRSYDEFLTLIHDS
jgi:acetyltransferase-like isoleucine patch superfamily enzyme/dTDP-4-dehydrorhamnose 3,5-epimerase-like enzyme